MEQRAERLTSRQHAEVHVEHLTTMFPVETRKTSWQHAEVHVVHLTSRKKNKEDGGWIG